MCFQKYVNNQFCSENGLLLLWMFQYMVDKYSHIHTATWLARFISWLQWRYVHTTLPQIMARVFISSSNFTSQPLNENGSCTRLMFITWSSESNFFGWTILMAAGDICVADLLNTVRHKMDSLSCSHNVYRSVWLPVIEQLLSRVHNKIR